MAAPYRVLFLQRARGVDRLLAVARAGDLVLTLGAGNVWQAGEQVLERLRAEAPNAA